MNRKLRMLLLSAALIGLPFFGARAEVIVWSPVGDHIVDAGAAIQDIYTGDSSNYWIPVDSSDIYRDGDRIWDISQGYNGWNLSFQAEALEENVLDVYGTLYDDTGAEVLDEDGNPIQCTLKIDGDVHIEAINADATVNFEKSPAAADLDVTVPTILEPYIFDYTGPYQGTEGYGYSMVVFETAAGRTLTINVKTDVTFRGRMVGQAPDAFINSDGYERVNKTEGDIYDMTLVFKGAGQTKFVLSDGAVVSFTGDIDYSGGGEIDPETGEITWGLLSNNAAGTKVFLCMDQSETQVNKGQNKVVFERELTGEIDARSMVYVGCNSLITYVGTDKTGAADDAAGCAALAFDPSNPLGEGRLILFLKGAYEWTWQSSIEPPTSENPDPYYYDILYKFPFNDAAVIVAGHYIPDFDDASFINPETFASLIEYNVPAGKIAKFNIVDNKFYAASEKPVPNTDGSDMKRLLWVINDVQNHGTLASDPYWYYWTEETNLEGYYWAWLNPDNAPYNVRRGFIIGINGVMDVYDNSGLAYVAGALSQVDPLAIGTDPENPIIDPSYLKERNPSALIIDNVDESAFYYENVEYVAGNPFVMGENARHAQMLFRGNAVAYFMESAASRLPVVTSTDHFEFRDVKYGYIFNFWARNNVPYNDDPVGAKDLDYDQALAVGEKVDGSVVGVAYDKWNLLQNDMTQQYTEGKALEGIHVFDAEGKASARSYANTTLLADPYAATPVARNYALTDVVNGTMSLSSVVRDYKGQEIEYTPISLGLRTRLPFETKTFERPLLDNGTLYLRYNSPAMYLNFDVQLFNTILRHDDATKYVNGVPSDSDVAYTGGEVYFFTNEQYDFDASAPVRYRMPELRFFNSSFQLHESACLAGVRCVYRDIPGMVDTTGSNVSIIKFFDHGDVLDTLGKGFGRALQFGSTIEAMADGSSNYATESAFVNVYKGNKPVYRANEDIADTSSIVNLLLQRGDEYPNDPMVNYTHQNAHHLFMLSQLNRPVQPDSHCWMMIGWPRRTTTDNISGLNFYPDYPDMPYPYADAGIINPPTIDGNPFPALPYESRTVSALPEDGHLIFPLDVIQPNYPAAPATVTIDGTLVSFGSWDIYGDPVEVPLTANDKDGIIYNSHGGKMTIGANGFDPALPSTRNNVTPVLFVDTLIAKLLWNDFDARGWYRDYQFSAISDLPADQVVFSGKYAVQPWGLTTEMMMARAEQTEGYIRIDANQSVYTNNTVEDIRLPRADQSGVEEMLIGWYNRDALPELSDSVKSLPMPKRVFNPARTSSSIKSAVSSQINEFLTRATESPSVPVAQPQYLLYVGPEDRIIQMRVSGATMADPFSLDVSGDGSWPIAGRVDEFVTQATEVDLFAQHFIGEGAHAVLFGEYGGTIGLGNRDWNEHSVNAWNLIGKEYVSIAPLGDMNVILNSDLIVADNLPLIATSKFGQYGVNRVSFYSNVPREIRVPSGCFLDLSAFGQGEYRQEIEFAGQVRLVLEDGAGIRFPSRDVASDGGVVLYFNDESQLVFEGLDIPGNYTGPLMANYDTIKLIGKGDIWLNKNAKMLVNGDVRVAVESDSLTPKTSITLSMQRQSACYVGDENVSGGIFQVGNPTNLVKEGDPLYYQVRFTLEMNGPEAMFQINREGFFGLGAGLINKYGPTINGTITDDVKKDNPKIDPDTKIAQIGEDGYPVFIPAADAWQVVPLYNVYRASIEIKQGIFQHSNIADGANSSAALMVFGPAGIHRLRLAGSNQAIVRGGGNIMNIPWLLEGMTKSYYQANIWDYAGPLYYNINSEWVKGESYSILGSAGIVLNEPDPGIPAASETWNKGRSVTFDASLYGIEPASWNTTAFQMFSYFGFRPYHLQQANRVSLGATQFDPMIGFVNLDFNEEMYPKTMERIVRSEFPGTVNGDVRQSLNLGFIDARTDVGFDPKTFGNRNS